MHDYEGYRRSEVADALGVAEGTSKCRLFKAGRSVRATLDEYERSA